MEKPENMILTAGPWITEKEIAYVHDAVMNGWNERYREYIEKFQAAFAKYIGMKYALMTPSGTSALHLCAIACDLKPGDEVLVPELSFMASASVLHYMGAKPVFVDIEKDTWVMNPRCLKEALTPKTKAIMPVHIYGGVCDMRPIMDFAIKHNLMVIEDAAPSIGSLYHGEHLGYYGKRPGSFGDVAAFSFQGAKIMITGEGGMFVTNNEEMYMRAKYYGDHCKDPNRAFWHPHIGYNYRPSNMQAALGLAQLERIDELVEAKRRVFQWYSDRLSDIKNLLLNVERRYMESNYTLPSIVLDGKFSFNRDELRLELKHANIDTRAFFAPLSQQPANGCVAHIMEKKNPVAYYVCSRGINLPGGELLKEETVDYIASTIRKLIA